MGRVKDRNYYNVSGWMINQLGLSGRELHAYAIIYGFTQDGETEFNGSINYIAEWLGSSRNTAINVLKSLVDKGLLSKNQIETPNGKRNFYTAKIPEVLEVVQKINQGSLKTALPSSAKTAPPPSAKTAPNNNNFDNDSNNNNDNHLGEQTEKNDTVPYNKIKDSYNSICKSLSKIVTISPHRKKAIAARWKEYGGIEAFENLFTMAEASSFLRGNNDRSWTATFDWLLKADNMAKVLEGNYRDKGDLKNANSRGTQRTGTRPGANQTEAGHVPAITTAELEDKLRKEGSFRGYPDFDAMFGKKSAANQETFEWHCKQ